MFGNLRGWIASPIIVLISLALVYMANQAATSCESPTAIGLNAAKHKIQLPISPQSVAPFMSDPSDGGEHYRKAVNDFLTHRDDYDKLKLAVFDKEEYKKDPSKRPPLPKLEGLDAVIKARNCSKASIFTDDYAKLFKYGVDPEETPVAALRSVGEGVLKIGQSHFYYGRKTEAKECFQAAFTLGAHMFAERIIWAEADAGLGLMGGGAYKLRSMAQDESDSETAAALASFVRAKNDYYTGVEKSVYKTIYTIRANVGDLLLLADNAGDKTWRVEAILALGRCQYVSETRGNELSSRRAIRRMANSSKLDPMLKAAAAAARDVTVEDIRQLGR